MSESFLDKLVVSLRDYVDKRIATSMGDLEVRLVARLPRFEGLWNEAMTYDVNAFVTWRGSLWCAVEPTQKPPNAPDSGWRLAAKKGRDSRGTEKNGHD